MTEPETHSYDPGCRCEFCKKLTEIRSQLPRWRRAYMRPALHRMGLPGPLQKPGARTTHASPNHSGRHRLTEKESD